MNVDFAITTPDKWASESLDERAKIIASPLRSSWATQRTVWARALSSAILPNDPSANKTNILYSGTQPTFDSSYNSKNFRPTYGLDSITVDFKGTMGSTKSCLVSFKCWTLEDLEILEKLYMVPGISVIVEWGFSIDHDGSPVGPDDKFLQLGEMDDPYSFIMDIIIRNRETYRGNYDGLVGIVTNFNYKLNESLGFDCQFELVAPGEMWLEQNSDNMSKQAVVKEANIIKKQSNLVYVFHELYSNYKDDEPLKAVNAKLLGTEKAPAVVVQVWKTSTREYDKEYRSSYDAASEVITTPDLREVYISWGYFVQLLNSNINKYRLDADGFVMADSKDSPTIALALEFVPVTILPKFCSLDPRICTFNPKGINLSRGLQRYEADKGFWASVRDFVTGGDIDKRSTGNVILPSDAPSPELNDAGTALSHIKIFGTALDKTSITEIYDGKSNIQRSNEMVNESPAVGFLNNIYVNTGFLRDIALVNTGEKLNIDAYLKNVLGELSKAVGDVWDLQFRTDEKNPHLIHIFDASYTSKESRTPGMVVPYEFKIKNNPKLLLQSANVESKLIDGFKELVLFGNSSDNGGTDVANIGMQLYTDKVKDGWKKSSIDEGSDPVKSRADGQDANDEEFGNVDPVGDLDLAYSNMLVEVTEDTVAEAKAALAGFVTFLNKYNPEAAVLLPSNQNILLPFNLGIQLDGFSGLIWGNAINFDYLPSRYPDRVFFQITKVQHAVTRETWSTSIETIFRLRPNTDVKNPVMSDRMKRFFEKGKRSLEADVKKGQQADANTQHDQRIIKKAEIENINGGNEITTDNQENNKDIKGFFSNQK